MFPPAVLASDILDVRIAWLTVVLRTFAPDGTD
jgi:hypothetical protein